MPGDDVLALRVAEVLAEEPRLARRRVAAEADARRRALAHVPEHHLDDVDRRPDVVRDPVRAPVDLRARRVPGVEDRADCARQLLARVLREAPSGALLVDLLERRDQPAQVLGGQLDVLVDAPRALQVGERVLEEIGVDAVDDLAVHLDQPAVGVVGEARVPGRLGDPLDRLVVQAEVEDRVHHPRHRDRGARAHGHEQRVVAGRRSACRTSARAPRRGAAPPRRGPAGTCLPARM